MDIDDNKPFMSLKQRDSKELTQGYSKWFRALECIMLLVFFSVSTVYFYDILNSALQFWFLFFPAALFGFLLADFIAGVVHWAFDTWGSVDFPFLGQAFIRPFRLHHVDPQDITRHDFIETNAAAAFPAVPVLLAALYFHKYMVDYFSVFVFYTVFFFVIFGFFTNQIHKWSHSEKRNFVLRFLQKYHIILNPKHHDVHHTVPFNSYYCITCGWMNPILHKIQFFPKFEKIIMKYTGAIPRKDDIGDAAANYLLNK